MSDAAVFGNLNEILPYRALGLDIYAADAPASAEKSVPEAMKEVLARSYRIILVTEEYYDRFARLHEERKSAHKDRAAVLLPVTNGIDFMDRGKQELKMLVEKAIGVDIFKEK